MTNARLGRMEQAPSTNSDKASLHDREVSVVPALTEDAEESTRASMKKPLPEPMMQGKDRADVARTISHPAGPEREALSDLAGMGAADRAGKTIHSAQVKSTAQQSSTHKSHISRPTNSPGHHSKACATRTVGCATAPTKIAAGQEATSAQVVKRGHQVTMIEVPDDEDDTSFQK